MARREDGYGYVTSSHYPALSDPCSFLVSADQRDPAQASRDERVKALSRMSKVELARLLRCQTPVTVWWQVEPEKWGKDELVSEVLATEGLR